MPNKRCAINNDVRLITRFYGSWKAAIEARDFAHEAVTIPRFATRERSTCAAVFPYPFPELKW